MRRCVALLLVLALRPGLAAKAEEWVTFSPLAATDQSVDGRERRFGVYEANRDGESWLLFLLQGGRIVDPSGENLMLAAGPNLQSHRGTMNVNLSGLEVVENSGYKLAAEGDFTNVKAHWGTSRASFRIPRLADGDLAPAPALDTNSTTDGPTARPAALEMAKDVVPLGLGLSIRKPLALESLPELNVKVIDHPAKVYPGIQPLGTAYRIESAGDTLPLPVELQIPVPKSALKPGTLIYATRVSGGSTSWIPATRVEVETGLVTFRTRSFSDWALYGASADDAGTGVAEVSGFITAASGCDENPSYSEIHLSSARTVAGTPAEWIDSAGGIGSYRIVIPAALFGEYSFKSVVGGSSRFIWAAPKPLPGMNISQAGAVHSHNFELEPTAGRMAGTVRDQDGEPIVGAKVFVIGNEGQRYGGWRGDGRYEVDHIGICEAGGPRSATLNSQVIHPDRDTCTEMWEEVTLEACITNHRDFVWKPLGDIYGTVNDEEGNAIEDARITVVAEDGSTYKAVTDLMGYSIDDVLEGEATVTAVCPEEEDTETQTAEIVCDENVESNFVLDCCRGEISGVVTDQDGEDVAGATVVATDSEGKAFQTSSDDSGYYELRELAAGRASVTATCPEKEDSKTKTAELECNEPALLDFTLECCSGDLNVAVFDEDGVMVDGALVTVLDASSRSHRDVTTGGEAFFMELPKGPTSVEAVCPEKQDSGSQLLQLECDDLKDVEFELDCSGSPGLQGTIEVQRGMAGAMEALLEGGFDLQLRDDDSVSGSGTGVMTIEVAGDGGSCKGSQNLALSVNGKREEDTLLLDVEFDDGGRAMNWKCGGGKPVGIDALVSFEDEGKGLKLSISSKDPFHASLNRAPGNMPFGTRLSIDVSER